MTQVEKRIGAERTNPFDDLAANIPFLQKSSATGSYTLRYSADFRNIPYHESIKTKFHPLSTLPRVACPMPDLIPGGVPADHTFTPTIGVHQRPRHAGVSDWLVGTRDTISGLVPKGRAAVSSTLIAGTFVLSACGASTPHEAAVDVISKASQNNVDAKGTVQSAEIDAAATQAVGRERIATAAVNLTNNNGCKDNLELCMPQLDPTRTPEATVDVVSTPAPGMETLPPGAAWTYGNGFKSLKYADGSSTTYYADGRTKWTYPNGEYVIGYSGCTSKENSNCVQSTSAIWIKGTLMCQDRYANSKLIDRPCTNITE